MRIVRSLLLVVIPMVFVVPSAYASVISVGDTVTFEDGPGNNGGGAFYLTVNGDETEKFISFCLQSKTPADFESTFLVAGVSDYAISDPAERGGDAAGRDWLSPQTAWLYSQLRAGTLFGWDDSDKAADAMQWAIWVLEDEFPSVPNNIWSADYYDLAQSYIAAANTAVANGYTGLGDVKVLNIVYQDGRDAQDQLALKWTVPEPSSLALFGLGASFVAFKRRRRANVATA